MANITLSTEKEIDQDEKISNTFIKLQQQQVQQQIEENLLLFLVKFGIPFLHHQYIIPYSLRVPYLAA